MTILAKAAHAFTALGLAGLAAVCSQAAAAQSDLSSRYVALAIQGDLRSAPRLFESAGATDPGAEDLAGQFRQRFLAPAHAPALASGDPFVDGVVLAYRAYWRDMLMGGRSPADGERVLAAGLAELLAANHLPHAPGDSADIYGRIGSVLNSRGFGAVLTLAAPLQDLFVWTEEEPRTYLVELTDQSREVRVVFLSGFSSLGWKDFASLGLATTTGWVEEQTLYCVEWAYLEDSENFEVSYLKHETQHLADYERFPGLSSVDLEYRAKLTELAFASTTLPRLLADFSVKAAPNPRSPHAMANQRVVEDLNEALRNDGLAVKTGALAGVSGPRINRLARALLQRDTTRLLAKRNGAGADPSAREKPPADTGG